MKNRRYKGSAPLFWLILAITLTIGPRGIHAEITLLERADQTSERVTLEREDGMIYTLPKVDNKRLRKQIKQRRELLNKQRQKLSRIVKKGALNKTDAAIVVILPGGFIYAALKHQRRLTAQRNLSRVNNELASLKSEQITMLQ